MLKLFFILFVLTFFTFIHASEVKIGVLAFRSKAETLQEWKNTAALLTRSIPGEHFTIVPMDYPELRNAAQNGSVDFIITNSGHYVYLEHLYGISRIATLMKYKNGAWLDRFGGVIFVRNDRKELQTLKDLEDKQIAVVDQDSLGGYAAPLFALLKADVDLDSLHLHFTGMPHDNVVQSVLSGKVDAGFVRTEVLEGMAKEGKIDLHSLRILNPMTYDHFPYQVSTLLYPEWPIARMPKTSLHLADSVVITLLSQKRKLPQEGDIAWTAPLEYQQIHEMFHALRLPPYDAPEPFTVADIYNEFKHFILPIGVFVILIIIGIIKEFHRQQLLRRLMREQIMTDKKLLDESRKNEALLKMSGDGMHILNEAGNIVQVGDTFCNMLGYSHDEMMGMNVSRWEALIPLEDVLDHMRFPSTQPRTIQTVHRRSDGTTYDAEVTISNFSINDELFIYCSARDISDRIHTQLQTKLAALVYEHSSDAIVIADQNNHIISVNPAFELLSGYTFKEIEGRTTNLLSSGKHSMRFYRQMWDAIKTNGFWEGEIIDRHKNGTIFSKWLTIRTIYDDKNAPYRYIAIFTEISDSQEAQKTIWYQANFDILTGLPNRSMFLYRLEKELQDIERTQMPLALMFLDLDHFKEINDTLGHEQGDILLQETAKRISMCIRKSDVLARLGGDEFTLIITQLDRPDILDSIANTILAELSHAFYLNGEAVYISASIGITIAPMDGIQADTLFINADQAMYAAKKDGRNRYRYFMSSMQEEIHKRMKLINELREAIEEKQFVLYYQPIVDVQSGEIHKAEALVRWQKPDGTMISPADFIPLSEETGLILELGSWIFREAIRQTKRWREHYDSTFQISLNKSPVQFRNDTGNYTRLIDLITETSLPAGAIVVEITEGLLMEQTPIVQQRLSELQHKGVLLSLDDFGTGYSSLSYLKKFDIDFLKIDQSFVKNLHIDDNDKALCKAIVAMAHTLGIKVIAEGVELREQADFLAAIGCDYFQGYLISRPIPAEEFEKRFLSIK